MLRHLSILVILVVVGGVGVIVVAITGTSVSCRSAMSDIVDENREILKDHPEIYNTDELLSPEQLSEFTNSDKTRRRRGLPEASVSKWVEKTVPYILSDQYNADEKNKIRAAMATISSVSCIKFKEHQTNPPLPFLKVFYQFPACYSHIGMKTNEHNQLSLTPNCVRSSRTIIHELLHTLGVYHEHERADRDEYELNITLLSREEQIVWDPSMIRNQLCIILRTCLTFLFAF
ncbi:zinc metalloproteinase nas-12-like [Hydractinia symbiolongicarpus]|uniref:zinc metalloproteinase nas-12-like n=1 Tax=Hydractinia symbiolongicarpus TaxID=13093 RepID=UPI00254F53AB|nr:zinc metalloproteinase nas-12-like [Hydractinia symbiolongicarpus]